MSEHTAGDLSDRDVRVLDAWLWPTPASEPAAAVPQNEPVAVEASMLPPTRRLLRDFPVAGLEQPYLRHLEQRIARNPRDLLSHVRRIYLADALGDRESVCGALIDLFLVLGRGGVSLRRRLLKLADDRLTVEQAEFFTAHLEREIDASSPVPNAPRSRFSKQLLGTTQIVRRPGERSDQPHDAVLLSRDSRARGRFDLAQSVLEGALEDDPGNKEVCEELLNLYSDRGLRRSFNKTYTSLLGRKLAHQDRWDDLACKFEPRDAVDG